MEYVTHHNVLGCEAKEIPCIVGAGTPGDSIGAIGLLYMDETTGKIYKRTATGWEPEGPSIHVEDSAPTNLSPYEIGDIILVTEE